MPEANRHKTICVVGLGYIGLPTAALFASHGHEVVGVDIDERKIAALGRGDGYESREPGLAELVREALRSGNLLVERRLRKADAFIISVPTPVNHHTKEADLTAVQDVAQTILPILEKGNLVVLESTVPPGTTAGLLRATLERGGLRVGEDFYLSHCPERAMPGRTLHELVSNPRVVGGIDPESARVTERLYASFVKGEMTKTDATTAEVVKLMENACRDIQVAMANEFARIAEDIGIDVWEAIELSNRHPRIEILRPGLVGGHCLPHDPWFLLQGSDHGDLIRAARAVNASMAHHVVQAVSEAVRETAHPTISIFGVSYKGDVDDTRESPAEALIELMQARGWSVKAHDPIVQQFSHPLFDLEESVKGSDCIVLVADHSFYVSVDPSRLGGYMRQRHLVDTRNRLDQDAWRRAGFSVAVLGRSRRA